MALSPEATPSSFETDAISSLTAVRVAFSSMLAEIGVSMGRPTDLVRSLGVDSKLSWQVYNVVHLTDPLSASKLVPGEPSLKRLLKAAQARGAGARGLAEVREAVGRFNEVVERHADDRAEFDFMASSVAGSEAAASAELGIRRTAFRAESQIWGVSSDLSCGTTIVRRASVGGAATDECTLINKRGCRRLRPDAPRSVFAYRNYGAGGAPSERARVPLDAEAAARYGAHLMPRFCSQPIPAFTTWLRPDGYTSVDVRSEEIGRQSAVSLTLGQVYRNCPLARDLAGGPAFQCDMRAYIPSRLLISFLLVHRPSFGAVRPSLLSFRHTPGDTDPAVAASVPQLPCREEVRYAGTGRDSWHSPDLPAHVEMVQAAFDELGWNPSEFDTHVLRIEYPALHSVARMQFPVNP